MRIIQGGQGHSDRDTRETGVGLAIVWGSCLVALGLAWLISEVLAC